MQSSDAINDSINVRSGGPFPPHRHPAPGVGYWVLGTGDWGLETGYWGLGTGYWVPQHPTPATRHPPPNTPATANVLCPYIDLTPSVITSSTLMVSWVKNGSPYRTRIRLP